MKLSIKLAIELARSRRHQPVVEQYNDYEASPFSTPHAHLDRAEPRFGFAPSEWDTEDKR